MVNFTSDTHKNFEFCNTEERIVPNSGLFLACQLIYASKIKELLADLGDSKRSQKIFSNGDVAIAFIASIMNRDVNYCGVESFRNGDSDFYKDAMNLNGIPSEETVRQRLNELGKIDDIHKVICEANINLIKFSGLELKPLPNGMVSVDVDVTPFINEKTHKEGASRTYKKKDGFAPIMAYMGLNGFLINEEFRIGSQHCQNNTVPFLKETIAQAKQLTKRDILFRLDSGNDSGSNIGLFIENNVYFLYKRNLRHEKREDWLKLAKDCCINVKNPREGKTVYIGSSWEPYKWVDENGNKVTQNIRVVYEITERTIDKNGQYLLIPDIEVNTYATNTGLSDEEVISYYHQHAEMEQYHSEIKTDMDCEKLPSGKFSTNALVLDLIMLAYNTLRVIEQASLLEKDYPDADKKDLNRRRLITTIIHLIYIPAHITVHARKIRCGFGNTNPWSNTYLRLLNTLLKTAA